MSHPKCFRLIVGYHFVDAFTGSYKNDDGKIVSQDWSTYKFKRPGEIKEFSFRTDQIDSEYIHNVYLGWLRKGPYYVEEQEHCLRNCV